MMFDDTANLVSEFKTLAEETANSLTKKLAGIPNQDIRAICIAIFKDTLDEFWISRNNGRPIL
jgi:hypothetical protein